LIGILLDIRQGMEVGSPGAETDPAGKSEPAGKPSLPRAAQQYLERQERLVRTAAGILALAAPAVYAALLEQPLVITYFQLLRLLIAL
jgi:hypothetical protein